ncbi:Uncharacterised protein [Shigella sonnei]|nr:Uncharacterised protein [Shigella sonnei]
MIFADKESLPVLMARHVTLLRSPCWQMPAVLNARKQPPYARALGNDRCPGLLKSMR